MAKKIKLTENTKVYFDELTHTYLCGDKELIGVTTLMKKMGISPSEYANIPQEVLERAAERGSATHKAIEAYCKGEALEVEGEFAEETIKNLEAFKRIGLQVLANEYLVSDNELIASSIDMVLDDLTLVDIKTTYKVHNEAVAWQLSIYKYLFELQNPKKKVKGLKVLHLRDGKAELADVQEIDRERVVALIKSYREGAEYQPPTTTELIAPNTEEQKALAMLQMIEEKIVALSNNIKEYEQQQEEYKAAIMALMKRHNVKKWEVSEHLTFTYVEPSTRTSLDSKRLQAERPDIYETYKKESEVKEALRIKVK